MLSRNGLDKRVQVAPAKVDVECFVLFNFVDILVADVINIIIRLVSIISHEPTALTK